MKTASNIFADLPAFCFEKIESSLATEFEKATYMELEDLESIPSLISHLDHYKELGSIGWQVTRLSTLYGLVLAKQMGLQGGVVQRKIIKASLFSDIGFLKMKDTSVGYKVVSNGKDVDPQIFLSPEELKDYFSHPDLSAEILKTYGVFDNEICDIVTQQHEHFGGKGPRGLKGEDISPLSRVLSLSYDMARIVLGQESIRTATKRVVFDYDTRRRYDPVILRGWIEHLSGKYKGD